jgi:uncharacterized membrane protein
MTMADDSIAPNKGVDDWLEAGIVAAKVGERRAARALLRRVVEHDPANVQGWLWLSEVVDDTDAKAHCFERVLALDPDDQRIRKEMTRLCEQRADRLPRRPRPAAVRSDGTADASPTSLSSAGKMERGRFVLQDEFILIAVSGLILVALIVAVDLAWFESLPAPLAILRSLLGLLLVLFVPGYALQMAFFPREDALDGPERLALSFGLSMAIIPPLALLLDALPWGIRLWPIIFGQGLLIILCSAVALWRRHRLPAEERFQVVVEADMRSWWNTQDRTGRILYTILAFAIVLAAVSVIAIVVLPRPGDHFTEFYLLGPEGLAEGYPREAMAGEAISVITGIANREGVAAEYRIEVRSGEQQIGAVGPFVVGDGEIWEGSVSYMLPQGGEDQQVLFLLYRDGGEPYHALRLWINVVEP